MASVQRNEPARVLLANGLPAFTRDRRIRQSDINRHGSATLARQALWGATPPTVDGEGAK
jgi:hypothetical protein